MATSPTIVAASLSDQELRESIDKLVNHVKAQTNAMAEAFTGGVDKMRKALQSLGDGDAGKATTTASSKSTQAQKNEVAATEQNIASKDKLVKKNKEVAMSFDQMAAAQQKAIISRTPLEMRPEVAAKSARDSYLTFVHSFKEQGDAIAQQIRAAEAALNRAVENRVNELSAKIETAKAKLSGLYTELTRYRMEAERTGNYSVYNAGILRTTQAIENQKKHIEELKRTMSEVSPNMFTQQVQSISQLRAEQERIANMMKDEVTSKQQSASATQQQVSEEQKLSAEILKQAKAIRESAEFKQTGAYKFDAYGVTHRVLANEKKYGSVEQQLLDIMQREAVYSREIYGNQGKSADATGKWAEAQERITTAEQQYMQSLPTAEEKQQQIAKHLQDAKNAYAEIQRNQERNQNLSDNFRIEATVDAIKKLEEAYKNLDYTDKRSKFGQELSAYIQGLKRELTVLTDKMNDEALMSANLGNSYTELSRKLQRLQSIYLSMNESMRNSTRGQNIADEIQRTSKAMQDIQRQMNRPTNLKSVLDLEARTLDDMAYKMQRLQAYRQSIDLTKDGAAEKLKNVDKAMQDLQRDMDRYMVKSKQMTEINNALGRSWNYMKNRLAFYFTVGASTQFVKNLIEIRAQYEMSERALGILIDSAERGSQIFKELSDMALVSPYTLIELSNAAKQLTAYDIAAKDVVDTTRRLADMSAAVGIPVERLTTALGQIKAFEHLTSLQARRFASAGIPLVKQLAEYYTEVEGKMVSVADVYDRMKKRAIGYNDVMAVVTRMTDEGGKFFDFQAKMAGTLKVQLANLTLAWNNMLNDIGASQQGTLTTGLSILRNLFLNWKKISTVVTDVATAYGVLKVSQLLVATSAYKVAAAQAAAAQSGVVFSRWMQVQSVLGLRLTNVLRTITASMTTLLTSPTTWYVAITAGLIHIWHNSVIAKEAIRDLAKSIEEAAKEANESIKKFLKEDYTIDLKLKAQGNLLSTTDAEKGWETIKEEIENSSQASDIFIAQLENEEDLSKRIVEAFDVASKIREATEALSEFGDKLIDTRGAAIADLDSLGEQLYEGLTPADEQGFLGLLGAFFDPDFGIFSNATPYKGAVERVVKVAREIGDVLKEELGEEGIKDKVKVAEAIERIRAQIIKANPEIQGSIRNWFNVELDKYISFELNRGGEVVFDRTTSLTRLVLEQIRKDSQSAFSGITTDILKETSKWTPAQEAAIQKAIDKIRKELPEEFDSTLDAMQSDLNSREWKINITTKLGVDVLDPYQQEQVDKFINTTPYNQEEIEKRRSRFATLLRKQGEGDLEYEKRLQGEKEETTKLIDRDTAAIKANSGALREEAEESKKLHEQRLQDINTVMAFGNYRDKETKKGGSKKDPVLDALKQEISLVEKLQSDYDKLTKSGASQAEALATIRGAYGTTMRQLNASLKAYGLPDISTALITGSDPNKALEHFKNTLNTLVDKGMLNLERSKEVEAVIEKFTISAKTYNLEKVTKGLNNELDKLKDEYELAVEMDATPELSNIFMDMIGLDEEQMSKLPRTAEQVAKKAQEAIDKVFAENNISTVFNLESNRNKAVFDEWVKQNGQSLEDGFVKQLDAIVDYVNKVRLDETKKQLEEWDKLLEKYAEYETKRKRIIDEAAREREVALRRGAGRDILDAIDLREMQELAKHDFDEFKKGAVWQTAISDLSSLTTGTLSDMADALERYKKSTKGLTSKEIKEINKTIKSLRKELRGDNPFSAIANAIDEAHERMELFDDDIQDTQAKLLELIDKNKDNEDWTAEDIDEYDRLINKLNELLSLQQKAGKVSLSYVIGQLDKYNDMATKIGETLKSWGEALDNEKLAKAGEILSDISTNIAASFSGAQAGSSVSGGNWIGALVGAIVGGLSDIIPKIAKWSKEIRNSGIDKSLEASKDSVEILKNSYQDLEYQIERAYGAAVTGAQRAILFNKKLQLVELERQLLLEKSRSSKDQDIETIRELEGQIAELRNGIKSDLDDITNDLLGISGVNSAAENLVSSMIDAFKKGEDYMQVYEDSFEKMVDNMIMKAIVAKIIGQRVDAIFSAVQKRADARAENDPEVIKLKNLVSALKNEIKRYESGTQVPVEGDVKQAIARDEERIKQTEKELADAYTKASVPNVDDIKDLSGMWKGFIEQDQAAFEAYMEGLGIKYGQDAEGNNLSALQQGIQGITEDTAGALEAITNGISQQCYLQSDLLTQIRDTIQSFDIDVQTGTFAEMLLQLQISTQTQNAIRSIMEGWSSPNGMSVRVEMV